MRATSKKWTVVFVVGVLVFMHLGSVAFGQENLKSYDEKAGHMAADFLVMRPMGIIATAAGSVLYVLSLPFSLLGGNQQEAFQKLIAEPAEYTFQRPLGEM
jgi:hypothetical protein